MVSSLSKIASAFSTELRSHLKQISTLPRAIQWTNILIKKPRTNTWYDLRTSDTVAPYHTAGYYSEGKFWLYGKHGPLSVRREVRDITHWRRMEKSDYATWGITEDSMGRFGK